MRISRKIGLGFFITFLLVIILGALSIYSLRHVYKGLEEVFSKDLPASRLSYQVSVSAEEVLSNLNNFFITANENFKASYERSYERLRDDMAGLRGFIFEPEERAFYEEAAAAVNDINDYASAVFKNSSELKGLFKEIRKTGADYNQKLDRLSGIEEDKMLGEKDLLLIQAQHVPASTLVMQAKTEFLALMDVLSGYLMGGQGGGDPFSPDQLGAIDKYIKDYKNYHSYSLSDEERSIAMSLVDLSEGLRSRLSEVLVLKDSADRLADSILAKEKIVMEALDKIIAYKKSGISVKLGIGAALTEDIPAIHNISKIEKDIVESWRLSARYILTKSQENRESYYSLRQGIENEMKDYGRHARLRGTESFLEDVIDADKKILDAISSSMDTFNKKENSRAEMLSIKAGIEKNIDELLGYNDARIKGGRDSQEVSGRFAPARWSLIRLKAGLYDAGRLIVNYLNEQESVYKDSYAELYFSMKKDINAYRNLAGGDARDLALINEAEAGLDRFNAVTQDVISAHDAVIKDVGWTLVKLEERLKDGIAKAVDSEIAQLDKNKRDLKGRIAIINTLIFV
ncbi:MAG: MCP four helix bundle domain-containing protein, partial [Candidatus Omnitrophota bacterium]